MYIIQDEFAESADFDAKDKKSKSKTLAGMLEKVIRKSYEAWKPDTTLTH